MGVMFLLPANSDLSKAQEKYQKVHNEFYEKRRQRYYGLSYYNSSVYHPPFKPISEMLALENNIHGVIVVAEISYLGVNIEEVNTLLNGLASQNISVYCLNPPLRLDPKDEEFLTYQQMFFSLFSLYKEKEEGRIFKFKLEQQKKKKSRKYPVPTPETIQLIRREKKLGTTLDNIAIKYNVSRNSVKKLTHDIPGINGIVAYYSRKKGREGTRIRVPVSKVRFVNYFFREELPSKLRVILKGFLLSKRTAKTRSFYQSKLSRFYQFLEEKYGLYYVQENYCNIYPNQINEFMAYLKNKEYRVRTILSFHSGLSEWFKFLSETENMKENPMRNVCKPKFNRGLCETEHLTEAELNSVFERVLADIEAAEKEKKDERTIFLLKQDFVIFTLLAATGLRSGSIYNMTINDYCPAKKHQLHVTIKGEQEADVRVYPDVAKLLSAFIGMYSKDVSGYWHVFRLNPERNVKMPSNLTIKYLRRIFKSLGIAIRPKLHVFRVSFAVQCHLNGIPLSLIRDKLFHADISTTNLYLKKLIDSTEEQKLPKMRILNGAVTERFYKEKEPAQISP